MKSTFKAQCPFCKPGLNSLFSSKKSYELHLAEHVSAGQAVWMVSQLKFGVAPTKLLVSIESAKEYEAQGWTRQKGNLPSKGRM